MSARTLGVVSAKDNRRNVLWKEMVLGDLDVLILQNGFDEGTSTREPSGSHQTQVVQQGGPPQVTLIDVDLIDDDVAVSSASAFSEAKINSRRKQGRTISDVNLDVPTRHGTNNCNKRQRVPPNAPIINCETYVDLTSSSSMVHVVELETLLHFSGGWRYGILVLSLLVHCLAGNHIRLVHERRLHCCQRLGLP
ncbi:hypothetical protein Droror1_Dr00019028 [Drosera rotundifolia]